MNLISFFRPKNNNAQKISIVTFSGGMGAQLISAAIYYHFRKNNQPIYADLTYFNLPRSESSKSTGTPTHWDWQLNYFGIEIGSFESNSEYEHLLANKNNKQIKKLFSLIEDGPLKLELSLKAFEDPEIRSCFPISNQTHPLPVDISLPYICIHIRRGDYLNVASHLIADRVFMEIAEKFRNLNLPIIVLSDSLIPKELGDYFHKAFKPAYILDSTDPFTAHIAMRNSAILICSNSQFSLISAALNPSALCIIPKQWFDANGKHIEVPIHSRSSFEVLS